MTDKQIIKGCRRADPRAQRALVDTYSPYLFTICRRYMSDEMMTQDALQETLIKVFTKMDMYNGKQGQFKSWMSTIAVRQCLQILRKADIRTRAEEEARAPISVNPKAPESMTVQNVLDFIAGLPSNTRVALNMYLIEGYNHREIADHLALTESTSRSLVSRGRQLLKARFTDIASEHQLSIRKSLRIAL